MPRRNREGQLRSTLVALALTCMLAPRLSEAGRRPFLFAYDSEIIPEGDVELEQWLWSESHIPSRPNRPALYWIWWAPVIGLTNHLELALPFQIVSSRNTTAVQWFSADARYRLFPREQDGGFQPLVRVAFRQAIQASAAPSAIDVDLVATYGKPSQLHLTVDLGAQFSLPWPENMPRPIVGTYGAGLAYPLLGSELRISVEFLGEVGLQDTASNAFPRHFVGGAIAWSRGRIWLTAGTMVGLTGLSSASPEFIPRLLWAVAL